ncbi:hypothetical protein Pyn_07935 [Prunus yedoensis var. nudiflora]|uniref:PB1-like domain-containing protein n=1 Tax=Prunus yedoensis var. nudiflora TaxID=2094558 RepID=A0A314ZAC3_PRUYE|nr:hypothetical protein Pyn_07935 [Prunus yedoensis var. nudiflora]
MVGSKGVDPKKDPIHPDDGHFIMGLRYASKFMNNGKDYKGGTIDIYDNIDSNRLSTVEFKDIMKQSGIQNCRGFYYTVVGKGVHERMNASVKLMRTKTKKELREASSHYAINEGYEVKVTKSDGKRMQAKCMKCKWNLWASFMEDKTLQIKSMTETHTGSRSYSNPQATASFFAKKLS